MPRAPKPQPLGTYHAVLSRLFRQMGEDSRIPSKVRKLLSLILEELNKLMVMGE